MRMKILFTTPVQIFLASIFILMMAACKKDNHAAPPAPHPTMEYFDLHDRQITANAPGFSIDVNHDGRKDIAFTTLIVGDPISKVDKVQFLASSNIDVNLPVNSKEEIPVISKGTKIVTNDFDGHHWFELSSIILVQKLISVSAPIVWEGNWKNATRKYVPYQVIQSGQRYNGWVELSVNLVSETVILHKAALSKEANKSVVAGE